MTYSAVFCISTSELHERLYAPYRCVPPDRRACPDRGLAATRHRHSPDHLRRPGDGRSVPEPSGDRRPCPACRSQPSPTTTPSPPARSSSAWTPTRTPTSRRWRSEEHTSELQSRPHLVCRLLLEKKKNET